MDPVIGSALIGAGANLLGGLGASRDARRQREQQERQWLQEQQERARQFRATHGMDLRGQAERSTAGLYDRQVGDDERRLMDMESNALLPMRRDIINSLYSRVGAQPHLMPLPSQRPPGAAVSPGGGTLPPAAEVGRVPPGLVPPQAGGFNPRQIDFSALEQFQRRADPSLHDEMVRRQVEEARLPNAGVAAPEFRTEAQRKQARKDMTRDAVRRAAQQPGTRHSDMMRAVREAREEANRRGL